MKTETQISQQFRRIRTSLDERGRRQWAASEALALGYGGIAKVHRATGIVPSTIGKAIRELRAEEDAPTSGPRRVREAGGGRKKKTDQTHFLLGVRGYDMYHPDRFALGILSVILGGGMSSRLFIEVRERRGLAYRVRTETESFHDAGDPVGPE